MNLDWSPLRYQLGRALPYLATAVIVIGFVNFFGFMAESMALGGDALNGKVVDGHYFLGSHGSYTEVDQGTWEWSRFHAISVFVTHPLAILGMGFVVLRRAFPAQMAGSIGSDPELAQRRVDLVRGSGPVIRTDSVGGRIGPVRLSPPLIQLSVYPKGLVVKPRFMPEHAILAAEILHIGETRVLLSRAVEIRHLGMGSVPPLVIYRHIDDPVIDAIRRVAASHDPAASALVEPEAPSALPEAGPVAAATDGGWAPAEITPPTVPDPRGGGRGGGLGLGRWSLAGQPAVPGLEPQWLSTVLEVLGLVVGAGLVASGLVWAIPKLGGFGIVWTIGIAAITAWNLAKFVRRRLAPR